MMKFPIGWWRNNHLEKYEFVNGKDDIPYIMENKNNETTNQHWSTSTDVTGLFHPLKKPCFLRQLPSGKLT